MTNDPIKLIEQTELESEHLIGEANLSKLKILRDTETEIILQTQKALKAAEDKAESLLREARKQSLEKQQKSYVSLEQDLLKLKEAGRSKQTEAVKEVLKMIPTLF